jgi:chloramphenicol-sensitive protein RarD
MSWAGVLTVPRPDGTDAEFRRGLVYGTSAYLLWGLFPLYWPLLEPAKPLEILAERMAWSMVVVAVILRFTGGFSAVKAIYADRRLRSLLFAAAVFVTVNWGTYIWGVNTHHVVETSLGYFINPLFTILLGVLVLGERLRPMQWAAVGIGAIAVIVIAVDYGRPPWIALVLATSFGLYGFMKKQAGVGAVESMAVETSAMFLPALIALSVIGAQGHLAFGRHGAGNALLLAGTGVVTVIPLLFFAAGTTRLPLSVLGLLQYLAPVLQFAVGVGIRHESTPAAELAGFGLVWIALVVLTVDGLRSQRSGAQAARAAASAAI